jgi:hypothetical protein
MRRASEAEIDTPPWHPASTVAIISLVMGRAGMGLALALSIVALAPLATADARRPRHSTCGTFCRQAGGLGGSPGLAPCKVLNSVIRENTGIAPVKVRCSGRHTARGAVVIYPHNFNRDSVSDGIPSGSYGGADLVAVPGRTVTLRILLSGKTVALLNRRHSLRVDVLIELNTKPIVQANTRNGLLLVPGG